MNVNINISMYCIFWQTRYTHTANTVKKKSCFSDLTKTFVCLINNKLKSFLLTAYFEAFVHVRNSARTVKRPKCLSKWDCCLFLTMKVTYFCRSTEIFKVKGALMRGTQCDWGLHMKMNGHIAGSVMDFCCSALSVLAALLRSCLCKNKYVVWSCTDVLLLKACPCLSDGRPLVAEMYDA